MDTLDAPHQRLWRCSVGWKITGSETEKVSLEHKAVLYRLDEQEVHGSAKST